MLHIYFCAGEVKNILNLIYAKNNNNVCVWVVHVKLFEA